MAETEMSTAYWVIGCIGVLLIIIYMASILVTFPLYVYVHRMNKKGDKGAFFYPITKHFYAVICSMQFYMYMTTSIAIVAWVLFDLTYASSVFGISFVFVYVIGIAVTSVQNVLLFVLALRRFTILFLPNLKIFNNLNRKTFKIGIYSLYTFYVSIQIVTKVVKVFCGTDSFLLAKHSNYSNESYEFSDIYDNCSATIDSIYVRIYILGDFLVMLAAVIYLVMFLKIRRWCRTTGDPLNHPEKYIFYQTVLLVITKLFAVTLIILVSYDSEYSDDWAFGAFVISDITTTPFVIQVSYLLCNRSNVDALLAIQFKKVRTWLVLICGAEPKRRPRRKRQEPAPEPEEIKTVTPYHK